MKAIVITRKNPNINFGQTVQILSSTKTNAVIRPDGTDSKYTVNISEIWPYDKAYDFEIYNKAVEKVNGWPWQNK